MICNRTRYKSPKVYAFQEFVLGSPPFWSRNFCMIGADVHTGSDGLLPSGITGARELNDVWNENPTQSSQGGQSGWVGRLRRAWERRWVTQVFDQGSERAEDTCAFMSGFMPRPCLSTFPFTSWLRVVTINSLYLNVKHESEKSLKLLESNDSPLTSTKSYWERQKKKELREGAEL